MQSKKKIKLEQIVIGKLEEKVIDMNDKKVIKRINDYHKDMEDYLRRKQYIGKRLEDVYITI